MRMTPKKIILKIVIPLVVLGVPFIVPMYNLDYDFQALLTIVSLLFTITLGFS